MAVRAAAAAVAANSQLGRGLRGLYSSYSSFAFNLPQTNVDKPPPPEPCTNLFVSGLSKRTTTEGLRDAFSKYGEVLSARVVSDRASGFSKGYGFVRYATLEEAAAGIKGMDGQYLDGWVIFAEYARPRSPLPPPNNAPPGNPQSQW